jgi:hypothetical protein
MNPVWKDKLKVYSVTCLENNELAVFDIAKLFTKYFRKLGYRWYELLLEELKVIVRTSWGTLVYKFKKGFRFDSRSGGRLVDLILPHIGKHMDILTWLVHDANAYSIGLSFRATNELMRLMLLFGGNAEWRANAGYKTVSSIDGWYGEPKPGDREYHNFHPERLLSFEWRP